MRTVKIECSVHFYRRPWPRPSRGYRDIHGLVKQVCEAGLCDIDFQLTKKFKAGMWQFISYTFFVLSCMNDVTTYILYNCNFAIIFQMTL